LPFFGRIDVVKGNSAQERGKWTLSLRVSAGDFRSDHFRSDRLRGILAVTLQRLGAKQERRGEAGLGGGARRYESSALVFDFRPEARGKRRGVLYRQDARR
jgi:hypothetical protein